MLCQSDKCGVCECDEKEVPAEWETQSNVDQKSPFQVSSDYVNYDLGADDGNSVAGNGAVLPTDWIIDEEHDKESLYINLLENAEAFTMYNGSHIWNAVYEENCFNWDG